MAANRLKIIEPAIQAADFTVEGGSRAMSAALDVSPAITAVLQRSNRNRIPSWDVRAKDVATLWKRWFVGGDSGRPSELVFRLVNSLW